MSNVLTKIVEDKKLEIQALKKIYPKDKLLPKKSTIDVAKALTNIHPGFIFECKKASPSKGLIRPDFNIEQIVEIYNDYASMISIVTDQTHFQGDIANIAKIRSKVTVPILCKDFFIEPYQVLLAAHMGADAILLMLSVLDDKTYTELASIADNYNLDIITEVSNPEETQRAINLGARIIGINNRNLRDLSINLNTTIELSKLIPKDKIILSESGIENNQQILELSPYVTGFLIGSSLMKMQDLDLACRTLIYGENKVCGLTNDADAIKVSQIGATHGGLIFAQKSKRCITIEQAKQIVTNHRLQHKTLNFVGVFVDSDIELIINYIQTLQLVAVQLHGNESANYIQNLKDKLQEHKINCQIWKAYAIENSDQKLPKGCDKILFDNKDNNNFGGTGKCFNWELIKTLPSTILDNAILSGGLTPNNAIDARAMRVSMLDFNSGVEITPGIKDHNLLNLTFNNLRSM